MIPSAGLPPAVRAPRHLVPYHRTAFVGHSLGIVKDHPQRVSLAAMQPTHAVAQRHAVVTSSTGNRPMIHREHHGVALLERHDFSPGLHSRALLSEYKLPAREIRTRC